MTRILVCGGRDFTNQLRLNCVLRMLHLQRGISVVIHGGASGADTLAGLWAMDQSIPVECYPADWAKYGAAAGPIRNYQMLAEGKPDVVVAFPRQNGVIGTGTADMARQAQAAGVEVVYG